jgi:hypothetical protein
MKRAVVKQAVDLEEVPVELLAQSIRDISMAAKKMLNSGLNRRALIVLIQDSCVRIGQREICAVLDSLVDLETRYCTKAAK